MFRFISMFIIISIKIAIDIHISMAILMSPFVFRSTGAIAISTPQHFEPGCRRISLFSPNKTRTWLEPQGARGQPWSHGSWLHQKYRGVINNHAKKEGKNRGRTISGSNRDFTNKNGGIVVTSRRDGILE
jgi:hypothetical protein